MSVPAGLASSLPILDSASGSSVLMLDPASGSSAPMLDPASGSSVGLPVGLQIMAPSLGEAVMYRVAAAFEAARNAADGGPLIQRVNGLEATV
jgi:hypothetical protein